MKKSILLLAAIFSIGVMFTSCKETKKEEEDLIKQSEKASKIIDERLVLAYHRIRNNALNGLGVVAVERDSCGGCFNKIPPQRQMDIKSHKKIIVCEHCGRIFSHVEFKVDVNVADLIKK